MTNKRQAGMVLAVVRIGVVVVAAVVVVLLLLPPLLLMLLLLLLVILEVLVRLMLKNVAEVMATIIRSGSRCRDVGLQ